MLHFLVQFKFFCVVFRSTLHRNDNDWTHKMVATAYAPKINSKCFTCNCECVSTLRTAVAQALFCVLHILTCPAHSFSCSWNVCIEWLLYHWPYLGYSISAVYNWIECRVSFLSRVVRQLQALKPKPSYIANYSFSQQSHNVSCTALVKLVANVQLSTHYSRLTAVMRSDAFFSLIRIAARNLWKYGASLV